MLSVSFFHLMTIVRDPPVTPERHRQDERAQDHESREITMTSPTERRERAAAASASRMANPAPPPPQPFPGLSTQPIAGKYTFIDINICKKIYNLVFQGHLILLSIHLCSLLLLPSLHMVCKSFHTILYTICLQKA